MEKPVPKWLTTNFLAESLQHEKNNKDIIVTNFTPSLAAPTGNNYGSEIVRVKVDYKNSPNDSELHSVSLIVKSELTEGPFKEFMEQSNMKLKEPMFYKKFLPEVKKIKNPTFAPKSFFSPIKEVTVLEDLKEKGFVMADRMKLLDFDHCRLYMEAAASFHASSFAVHKSNPELVESIGEDYNFGDSNVFELMVKLGFKSYAEQLGKMEKFKKYRPLIERHIDDILSIVQEAQRKGEVFNTLTQGDPWTTNMMFRYDSSGKVCEAKLLDFQALKYASPANDVVFFIWTSAKVDVKTDRLDELYRIYVDFFNRKLKEFGCSDILTYGCFMDSVTRLSPLPFYFAGTSLPFISDPTPIDFSSFVKGDEGENPYIKYYTEEFCTNILPRSLEAMETAGVFSYMENYKKTN